MSKHRSTTGATGAGSTEAAKVAKGAGTRTGKGEKASTRSRRSPRKARGKQGLAIERHFTQAGEDPFDSVEWELRTAHIGNEKGETVFEQKDCEIPRSWSQLATNVVVSKYFRGHQDTPQRERSIRQLIGRVVGRITS